MYMTSDQAKTELEESADISQRVLFLCNTEIGAFWTRAVRGERGGGSRLTCRGERRARAGEAAGLMGATSASSSSGSLTFSITKAKAISIAGLTMEASPSGAFPGDGEADDGGDGGDGGCAWLSAELPSAKGNVVDMLYTQGQTVEFDRKAKLKHILGKMARIQPDGVPDLLEALLID